MSDPKESAGSAEPQKKEVLELSSEISAYIDKKLDEQKSLFEQRFEALQVAIEQVNKTAQAAAEDTLVQKPVKRKPLPVLETESGTFKPKGYSFDLPSKTGEAKKIEMLEQTSDQLKKLLQQHPSLFIKVED